MSSVWCRFSRLHSTKLTTFQAELHANFPKFSWENMCLIFSCIGDFDQSNSHSNDCVPGGEPMEIRVLGVLYMFSFLFVFVFVVLVLVDLFLRQISLQQLSFVWHGVTLVAYNFTLRWCHGGRDSVSNHQPHDCLLNRYSDADQRKHQSSASLAFVWGIHRGPVNSPHKWPVARKMFPFDDVIMNYIYLA